MSRPVRPLQYITPAGASGRVTPGSILKSLGGDGSVAEWADPFQAGVINHVGENAVSLYGVVDAHNELVTSLGRTGNVRTEPHLWFGGFGNVGIEIEHNNTNDTPNVVTTKKYKPYNSISDTPLISISQVVRDLNALFPTNDLEWIYQGNILSVFIKKGSVKFNAPLNSGIASDKFIEILFNGAANKPSISDPGPPIIEHKYISPKSFISNPFISSSDNIYPLPGVGVRLASSSDILFKRDQDIVTMTFSPSTTNTKEGTITCVNDGIKPSLKLGMKNDTKETTLSVAASSPHVSIKSEEHTKISLGDFIIAERASIELDTSKNHVSINGSSGTTLRIGMPIHDGISVGSVGQVLRSEGTSGNLKWRYGGAAFVKTYTYKPGANSYSLELNTNVSDGIKDLYTKSFYNVRIFAQGGGGGGAGGDDLGGGGGGGAGYIMDTFLRLKKDTVFEIIVGDGGQGGAAATPPKNAGNGDPGEDTIIGILVKSAPKRIVARGGGGGNDFINYNGTPGMGSIPGDSGLLSHGGNGGGLYGGIGSNGIDRTNIDAGYYIDNKDTSIGIDNSIHSGSGGGGGGSTATGGTKGGKGAPGFVRIEIYME